MEGAIFPTINLLLLILEFLLEKKNSKKENLLDFLHWKNSLNIFTLMSETHDFASSLHSEWHCLTPTSPVSHLASKMYCTQQQISIYPRVCCCVGAWLPTIVVIIVLFFNGVLFRGTELSSIGPCKAFSSALPVWVSSVFFCMRITTLLWPSHILICFVNVVKKLVKLWWRIVYAGRDTAPQAIADEPIKTQMFINWGARTQTRL